jgi:hypothetical protein
MLLKPPAILVTLLLLVGCAGPKMSPGLSALQVTIHAEPKAGYKPPAAASSDYGSDDSHEISPYSRFDYEELDEIVVWLEGGPGTVTPLMSVLPRTINLAAPPQSIVALPVGNHLLIRNNSAKPDRVFLRYEAGGIVDLGTLAPGAQLEHVLQVAGPVELVSDTRDQTLCTIFAAPGFWAQVANSAKPVLFNNLPAGTYHATCWHSRLPGSSATVELSPNHLQRVSLTVGVNKLPKIR